MEFKNLLRSHGMNFLFVVVCDALLIALAKFETQDFAYRPETSDTMTTSVPLSYRSGMGSCIFQMLE